MTVKRCCDCHRSDFTFVILTKWVNGLQELTTVPCTSPLAPYYSRFSAIPSASLQVLTSRRSLQQSHHPLACMSHDLSTRSRQQLINLTCGLNLEELKCAKTLHEEHRTVEVFDQAVGFFQGQVSCIVEVVALPGMRAKP